MSLRDLKIEKCYETNEDKYSLLENFYIPVLANSKLYLRIAGFFSSTSLAIVSKGIEGLIENDGIMKLLISPELSEEDYNVIIQKDKLNEFDPLFKNLNINDSINNEYLQLFAWMLANDRIQIKIVVDRNSYTSLFHQKVGIFFDEKDCISFSGSINETAQAWLNNIEEFKTFKSWENEQNEYVLHDIKKFNDYWNNERKDISIVYDLPDSIREKIIKIKPKNIYDLNIMSKYKKDKKVNDNTLSLFEHQKNAVKMWLENDKKLLFEMATGTGKTRTAIGCILEQLKTKENTVYLIATPQNTLSRQWQDDIKKLGIEFDFNKIVDGSISSWKKEIEMAFININLGIYNNAILFTSHDLTCKDYFIEIINKNKGNCKILFICDEVHAMGADQQQKGLIDNYDYRIGLSATPERLYDDEGTSLIKNYFGSKSFIFSIKDALNTINPITGFPFLNHFIYKTKFIELEDSEYSNYKKYSKQIAIELEKTPIDKESIQKLNIKRAEIVKNANNKYLVYEEILNELIGSNNMNDCISFVSPNQITNVLDICSKKFVTRAKITESESAKKVVNTDGDTERQNIIKKFSINEIQMLIGIYCLDEGIDIPNARIAILMASSTNPREYIQRIGRVIRYAPNKKTSVIYDLIVLTDNEKLNLKEAKRALSIAENAENFEEVKQDFIKKGVNISCL